MKRESKETLDLYGVFGFLFFFGCMLCILAALAYHTIFK